MHRINYGSVYVSLTSDSYFAFIRFLLEFALIVMILDGHILFFIEMIRRVVKVGKEGKIRCYVTIV